MTDRQSSRHDVRILGRYRSGAGIKRDVTMLDVSETGCRFYDRRCVLRPDMSITIRIETLGPFDAQVRWVRDDLVGVQFANPVYGPVFEFIRDSLDNINWKPPKAA
uniref:PilZ domain-containing protein n=1 Tax=Parerythrobacter lutipelagi TaxID=1964208 RepID=UPI0010F92F73|nr:PilZ domain-containing protein [Parerythrobacter lutipelagi]